MDQNENWKDAAAAINRSYPLGRLREIGLPEEVATRLGACLYALTQHGGDTWKGWCGDILKHLAPYREIEGLAGLITFAETHAGNLPTLPSRPSPIATAIVPTATAPVALAVPEPSPEAKNALAEKAVIITPEPQALAANAATASANGQGGHHQDAEETITEPAAPEARPEAVAKPEQGSLADMHTEDAPSSDRDYYVRMLPISQITADESIQPRAKPVQGLIDEYADAIEQGADLPPVIVFCDFSTNWLADGFYRLAATEKLGLTEIKAEVRAGDRRDAMLYAVAANAAHGSRRTNADKRRAVEMLLQDDEWSKWSDSQIARQTGVSHTLVGKLRSELSCNGCKMDGQRKVKRGDTEYTMNTEGIGGVAEAETEELDGVVEVDAQPGTVELAVSGNDDAAKGTPEDKMATESESVASSGADADAGAGADTTADVLIPRTSDKRAGAGVEPTAVEVFVVFARVLEDLRPEKLRNEFFERVKRILEDEFPGFTSEAIKFAIARKRERQAGKISAGKTAVGSDPAPLVAGSPQSEP